MKAFTRYLIQSFSLLIILGTSSNGYSRVRVSFSPKGGVNKETQKQLAEAVNTVDVAMYALSDSRLISKLIEVSESGVQVRMVLNKADKNRWSEKLEKAGVDIRYVTKTMHHKFTIIDGPQSADAETQKYESESAILMTGSGNWSSYSDQVFDEDFLVISDHSSLINRFQHEFNFLWKHSADFPGPSSYPESAKVLDVSEDDKVVFTSANFSPIKRGEKWTFRKDLETDSGSVAQKLIDTINETESGDHLRLALNHFLKEDLSIALHDALGRGVEIEMVLNQSESWDLLRKRHDGKFDESLSDLGAEVLYKVSTIHDGRGTKLMHAKFMVINDDRVLTGSYNWSKSSEFNTFENLIDFNLKPLAKKYISNFKSLQSYGDVEAFKSLLVEVKKKKGTGPCLFAPLSLTRSEIVELKSAYKDTACRR